MVPPCNHPVSETTYGIRIARATDLSKAGKVHFVGTLAVP
jgi:hypothetical protein